MIVSIASGKGGTGKTTVATNLARVRPSNMETWLLDCDVEAPNAHLFLSPDIENAEDVEITVPEIDETKCDGCGICDEVCAFNAIAVLGDTAVVFPELCHGCGGCARFCLQHAIAETRVKIGKVETGKAGSIRFARGLSNVGVAVVPPVVRAVRRKALLADQGSVVLVDAPPGTGCPVVAAVSDSDYCLLVTEPTPFGLNDLKLAAELVRSLGIPCGVLINRSGLAGETSAVDAYCDSAKIPIHARIPFDRRYASLYARGGLWVDMYPDMKQLFEDLWASIFEQLDKEDEAE